MRYAGVLLVTLLLPTIAHAALVNINTANAALLDTLPGIGPAKAAAIIDYRTQHGPFVSIEDIQNVSGIGPATFANLKDQITVSGGDSAVQPSVQKASYEKVQTVEQITSTTEHADDNGVVAPTAARTAAVGAVSPPVEQAAPASTRASGLFSPWALGLLAVILIAGGAFIFL